MASAAAVLWSISQQFYAKTQPFFKNTQTMQSDDSRTRFILEKANVRGVLVRLNETWREVLARADYPGNVQQVLGHAMVAVPLMASNIKFTGKLTLQAKGTGPVNLLVVQGNADGGQRGLARWKSEPPLKPLEKIFGDATLTIQIETGKDAEVYQGVVQAQGEYLQDALADYFENSEQLPTKLVLVCAEGQAAGLMLQQLPVEDADTARRDDDWHRVNLLAETIESDELYNKDPLQLLRQVFAEDDLRVFDAEPLHFQCGCSRERTAGLIQGMGYEEAIDILKDQSQIEITCEFCSSKNVFDSIDVEAIFRGDSSLGDETVVH